MTGRSLTCAMASTTSRVKAAGMPETPISAVGRSARTASSRVWTSGCSWAYGTLCSARVSPRPRTTRPFVSTNQQLARARASVSPSCMAAVV